MIDIFDEDLKLTDENYNEVYVCMMASPLGDTDISYNISEWKQEKYSVPIIPEKYILRYLDSISDETIFNILQYYNVSYDFIKQVWYKARAWYEKSSKKCSRYSDEPGISLEYFDSLSKVPINFLFDNLDMMFIPEVAEHIDSMYNDELKLYIEDESITPSNIVRWSQLMCDSKYLDNVYDIMYVILEYSLGVIKDKKVMTDICTKIPTKVFPFSKIVKRNSPLRVFITDEMKILYFNEVMGDELNE